jgi:hypothetical protein
LFPIGGSNKKEIEQQGREGEVGGRGKEEERKRRAVAAARTKSEQADESQNSTVP